MKSVKYITIVLVALLALAGCKDKMRELNTNADLVSDTQVTFMFTGATLNFDFTAKRSTDDYINSLLNVMQYHTIANGPSASNNPYYVPANREEKSPSYLAGTVYGELFSQNKGNQLQSILNYIDQNYDRTTNKKYEDIYAISKGLLAYMQWRVLENYGATVYFQAFKAISENVTTPEYDLINDVWDDIDADLKYSIDILNAPADENVVKLGTADFFAGHRAYPIVEGGATVSTVSDYDTQRNNWLTFFNDLRLEIAWKLKGRQAAHFSKVLTEWSNVANNGGIMDCIEDGFFFNYAHDYCCDDDMEEPARDCILTDAFVTSLCNNKDPRLPYLARPSGGTDETSISFCMLQEKYPDKLKEYAYLDNKHPYMGVCASPAAKSEDGWITMYNTPKWNHIPNPNGTAEFTFADKYGNSYKYCEAGKDEFSTSILAASQIQMRYWVICGARHNADHGNWGNGLRVQNYEYHKKLHGDGGTIDEGLNIDIANRCRIFTYAKQCFLLAAIGTETNGTLAGKSGEEWYKEGIQAAFDDLAADCAMARNQAYVGGDTGFEYPNQLTQTCGDEDITFSFPYRISQDAIDAYIAAHPYEGSIQNVMDQVYIYGYTDPYTAFTWYRRTGYPEFKSHKTKAETYNEKHVFMETPYDGTEKLLFPRRGCLPNKGAINANWYDAKNQLMAQEGFGEWYETSGGIWWEVPYMN